MTLTKLSAASTAVPGTAAYPRRGLVNEAVGAGQLATDRPACDGRRRRRAAAGGDLAPARRGTSRRRRPQVHLGADGAGGAAPQRRRARPVLLGPAGRPGRAALGRHPPVLPSRAGLAGTGLAGGRLPRGRGGWAVRGLGRAGGLLRRGRAPAAHARPDDAGDQPEHAGGPAAGHTDPKVRLRRGEVLRRRRPDPAGPAAAQGPPPPSPRRRRREVWGRPSWADRSAAGLGRPRWRDWHRRTTRRPARASTSCRAGEPCLRCSPAVPMPRSH